MMEIGPGQAGTVDSIGAPMARGCWMSIIGHGIYDLTEAARFTGLRRGRIREWFLGRSGMDTRSPVFRGAYQTVNGECFISFLDLVEVFIAGQLRNHGVSLQYIRRAHAKLKVDWET